MATQDGHILIRRTIGNITYYKMGGEWYARKKSSLDKERVTTDPAFKNSRAASRTFGKAARLSKIIYDQLPAEKKGHGKFGKLTGVVSKLLKQGYKPKAIKEQLQQQFT